MPKTDEDQNYLAKEISKKLPVHKVYNSLDGKHDMDKISGILDIVFGVVIGLTMFLCFFSLTSSMTSNLFEQTKEIAVLRSIGLTKGRIRMLYIYEAFILVSASCLLGVIIGSAVSFTMSAQQSLFVGIPLKFFFPWQEFLLILGLSFICALLSTLGPSAQITNKQISQILKMI